MLLLFLVMAFSQAAIAEGFKSPPLTPGQREDSLYLVQHYQVRKEMIPMRDGVKLYTEIFVPRDASKAKAYPFLMTRTPYNASRTGRACTRGRLLPS
jgi:predicted acyl esterase